MSDATAEAVETHDDDHHDHPSDWEYVKIAAILAIFTAIEVLTYFESVFTIFETRWVLLFTLFFLMIVKFALVGWYFMHLKQDKKVLSQFFISGIVLAVSVYVIFLLAFNFWG
ncbi:MAG: cytochrome C oxidase subunit IV family protein [Actinomycetota bacterium]